MSVVLAGVLVAAGLPLLVQPAAATEWTPGDAWDLGTTNAAVGGRPFSGQGSLRGGSWLGSQTFYAFVEAGGSLEVRILTAPWNQAAAAGTATIRVTSPEGQTFFVEQAFEGRTISSVGIDAVRELIIGVDEPLTSSIAGVWTIDLLNHGTTSTSASILRWDVVPRDADGRAHQGRVWTYAYHRSNYLAGQNVYAGGAVTVFDGPGNEHSRTAWDQTVWVWSPEGLLVRVDDMGYNGVQSIIQATTIGLVDDNCQPVRGSQWEGDNRDILDCGVPMYRVFFEHPDTTMPAFAQYPNGSTQWINFPLTMPSIDSVTYTQTGTGSVFDGQIAFTLSGQPATVRVEIDTNGDGNFGGPADRVLFDGLHVLPGTHNLSWNGLDANGVAVSLDQSVGVRVTIQSSFETHIVASDVERRLGGIRMTALNGPMAASDATRYLVNWDDANPSFFDAAGGFLCSVEGGSPAPCRDTDIFPSPIVGRQVDSRHGVHRWGGIPDADSANLNVSWGDVRDIVTWQVAEMDESVTVVITGTGVDITIGDDLIIGDDEQFFCPVLEGGLLPVVVTNHGPTAATGVRVSLPAGVTLAPEQTVGFTAGHTHPVLIGNLAVGQSVTFYVHTPLTNCGWDVPVQVIIDQLNRLPEYRRNDISVGEVPAPEVDLEVEISTIPDEDGEPILPACPPAGDIELLVTVTNHGPANGTNVAVTLPAGTVLAPNQNHVSASGNLVTVGNLAVGDYVTFYVLSDLSEDCAWDVTVTVEGDEYDPYLPNNSSTSTGTIPYADLEIEIEVPVDEDGEPVLPACPPAGDIELLVRVTNHGPYAGTDVTVTLPVGTVVAEGQDHISVTEEGLVLLGDLEVDAYVTFYVLSPLSEDCAWDVTVTVEGDEYDPYLPNNSSTSTGTIPYADLEIEIEVPVDEDGEPVLPVCPPAGEIQLLVTVTNHGPYAGTDVTVTLPSGTVVAPGQDHVTVTSGEVSYEDGALIVTPVSLVSVGDLEVGEYVTFYVLSDLSEDCAWDVTVTVEGNEYDPYLPNNSSTSTGTIPGDDDGPYPGLGGGQEVPGGGDNGGDLPAVGGPGGDVNLGGGQEAPAAGTPGAPAGPGANAPAGPSAPVRTPARLPLTGASGIWIAGAGLAVVGGLLLALNARKTKAAATTATASE